MADESALRNVAALKAYFDKVDSGEFPSELFTPDFEFYWPKFGIGRGKDDFFELARGIQQARVSSQHHRDRLQYISAGDVVVVEGCTEGLSRDNVHWCGGETPGGRFCSVFHFDGQGLIKRMYIYLDPDFTGADTQRFLWPERKQIRW